MKKAVLKKKSVKKSVHRFGPIAIAAITVFYLIYRVVIVVYPATIAAITLNSNNSSNEICNQDGDTQNLSSIMSESYQDRIATMSSTSPNLVVNPDVSDISQSIGRPVGYETNVTGAEYVYQTIHNTKTKRYFLRVINSQTKHVDGTPYPAWLMTPIKTETGSTYAYSFRYRGNTSAAVSIEYWKNNQQEPYYAGVTTLDATEDWKIFSAHFNAFDEITSFRIVINGVSAGQIDTGSFSVNKINSSKLSAGIVSVVFEDGWQSVAGVAQPIIANYDIQTTQYIISNAAAGSMSGYMDSDAVRLLKSEGHEIGSHSLSHCDQTELDSHLAIKDAVNSKQKLEELGLGPITSFAYPLGRYNELTQLIYSRQYKYILTSDSGYNDKYFDETHIKSMGILDTTTESEFKSWLDYAKKNKQWLVISYHRVNESGAYNITSSEFDHQMKMVVDSGLDILPVSRAADSIRN